MKICGKCNKRTSKPTTIMSRYYCPTCTKLIKKNQPLDAVQTDAKRTLDRFFGV